MRVRSGPAPVAMVDRQTGASEGNVEPACPRAPRATSSSRLGAAPVAIAAASVSGARPSTTIRTSFFRATGQQPMRPRRETGSQRPAASQYVRNRLLTGPPIWVLYELLHYTDSV